MSSKDTRSDSHLRLAAGATSGFVNCVLTQPLDLLKTRLQQEANPKGSVLVQLPRAYREVIQAYGVQGLWRGTLPSVMRTVPGAAMYFTLLGKFRAQFPSLNPSGGSNKAEDTTHHFLASIPANEANMISGSAARALLALTFMPITVIKSRYESSLYRYSSLWNASRSIYREGGARGFFLGFGSTAMRDVPYAGLFLGLYERFKSLLSPSHSAQLKAATVHFFSAMAAGGLATALTHPFDLLRTKTQLNPKQYPNMRRGFLYILQHGRWQDLWSGLELRVTRKMIGSAVAWTVYEQVLFYIRQWNQKNR